MDIATPPPATRLRWPWIAAAVVLVAVLGFGAYLAFGHDSGPSLTVAEQKCNDGRTDARVDDGGKTLIISTSSDPIRTIVDTQTVGCVFDYLKMPAAVRSHIEGTRALDGRQTDSWDGFTAAWTFYSQDGLNITIEQK